MFTNSPIYALSIMDFQTTAHIYTNINLRLRLLVQIDKQEDLYL